MNVALMFVVLGLLMALGVPVAFALLIASVGFLLVDPTPNQVIAQQLSTSIDSFPLLAIAFFVFLGTVMSQGMATRLIGFVETLVGHWKGGLAQVAVFNSVIMGGMCGSANADAAIDAKVLVPVMRKHGYPLGFSAALTAAAGTITPMIPPGISLIIYGLLAQVSIGKLFVGGIGPALTIALILSVIVAVVARRRGYGNQRERRAPLGTVLRSGYRAVWALAMPFILLVGLRMGVFTPTELGAIAAVYAVAVTVIIYREIPLRDLPKLIVEGVLTTATIMLIIAAASLFGWILTSEGIPQRLLELLLSVSSTPWVVLLVLNVAMLLLGMIVESNSLLIILAPILAPLAAGLGVDPVQFGVMIVLNMVVGSVTPPIGTVVYTVCSILRCPLELFSRESVKFVGGLILALGITTYVPIVVTLPVQLVYG